MRVLSLNGGSSSLKFTAYDVRGPVYSPALSGQAQETSPSSSRLSVRGPGGELLDEPLPAGAWTAPGSLERIFGALAAHLDPQPQAVGHRIVFGGPSHVEPVPATTAVLQDIERLIPLDPLHLRPQLDVVRAAAERFPRSPQVLCFDTAFHRRMPAVAKRLPLARALGPLVQRYGFHGLSYEYVISELGEAASGRVIIAHLGSGASLCALRDGAPLDTTMGFSPLGGLVMGTRPGDLDPGVVLYLLGALGFAVRELDELLNRRAGLLAVSESSSNMQALLAASATDSRAAQAVELFVYALGKHLGSMVAVLGGLDTLVFTAGIGEHAPQVRSRACGALAFLGLRLNEDANARGEMLISRADSAVGVRVVPTDENLVIARHAVQALTATAGS